ncbi:D-alanyl-D-alanine carboxypeptidase [Pacificimonas sp. WHA3]|uniref:D-alanyl-D-alanine carboxypeptidase n=1 Tax=Pacificimonas pallii TaxID=2827236 RepID=A0ABS6SFH5_9SPHN|nr:D-alanyl-D-alanine carboxypeptidase family protein [Pacificimonas pallii]MBV7256818.1 D-alanyl-D-alanine carboxypeptidase [Pacificimonas pallii]
MQSKTVGGQVFRLHRIITTMMALAALSFLVQAPVHARSLLQVPKYAAIVMDMDTEEVLYAHNAEAARHPASITKVMTLMLAFEALDAGKIKMDDRIVFSKAAAAQPPSKLGLGQGGWISVEEAIRLLSTKSANDVAVALAEHVEGSELAFAQKMTEKARDIGMTQTAFYNASGLPNPAHSTSARDLAIMSKHLITAFPHYYAFFSQQSYNFYGKRFPNHNRLLGKLVGLDGIKTGYTNASGYTLAASAQRDGKRLIAIVLGAPSGKQRNENIASLINAGFEVLRKRRDGRVLSIAQQMLEPVQDLRPWATAVAQGSLDEEEEPDYEPTRPVRRDH